MSRGGEWPEAFLFRLRDLWGEGHSTAEIGRRLGKSKNAVVGKAHRLDLPSRPSPIISKGERKEGQPSHRVGKAKTLEPLPSIAASEPQFVPPAPPPKPIVVVPKVAAAPVLRNQCCWPLNNGENRRWLFCEAPCERTYCTTHAEMAHGIGTASERRAVREAERLERRLHG